MSKLLDIMLMNKNFLENHKKYLKRLYQNINDQLEDPEVFLFGSIVEGNMVAASDIDILVIAEVPRKHQIRAKIRAKIEEESELPLSHPFEIHIITEDEFQKWNKIYNLNLMKLSDYISSH